MHRLPPRKDMPSRPPDWRWERARWLIERGKYAKKFKEDDATIAAKTFQLRLRKCKKESDYENLIDEMPDIYWAHHIYEDDENVTKYQIEARLLAGDSYDRISKRCFVKPEVIDNYEKIFFNVSEAVKNASLDYLCGVVVGRAIYYGVTERDYDILWKIYGIASIGRPEILDDLLTTLGTAESLEFFQEDLKKNFTRKAAILSRTVSSSFNPDIVIEAYTKLKDLDLREKGENSLPVLFNEHVSSMLNAFSTVVQIGKPVEAIGNNNYIDYQDKGLELRAHEMVELAENKEINIDPIFYKFSESEPTDAEQHNKRDGDQAD